MSLNWNSYVFCIRSLEIDARARSESDEIDRFWWVFKGFLIRTVQVCRLFVRVVSWLASFCWYTTILILLKTLIKVYKNLCWVEYSMLFWGFDEKLIKLMEMMRFFDKSCDYLLISQQYYIYCTTHGKLISKYCK